MGDESESIAISKTKRGYIIGKLLLLFLKLTFWHFSLVRVFEFWQTRHTVQWFNVIAVLSQSQKPNVLEGIPYALVLWCCNRLIDFIFKKVRVAATILLITGNYRERISRVVASETNRKAKNLAMAKRRFGGHTVALQLGALWYCLCYF